ncbi:MAG: hypothetical protein IMX01_01430 [Limnochordaceae bacterium]|nr:hypothetical protein [Limnochordaceae bacterium]
MGIGAYTTGCGRRGGPGEAALFQANPWVLAAGWGVALLISLVFGLIPAIQAEHVSPAEVLRE